MSIARVPNAAMIRICKAFKEDKDNDGGGGAYAGPSGYAIRTAWASLYEEIGVTEELAVDGRPFHWHCISFSKALQRMATESPLFTQALKQIWLRRPCTAEAPFQIVFYADEVTPGTLLKPDNKRKIWCFYVSIKELGPSLLKHEAVWIPLACLRSTIAGNLSGGASEAFGVLLRRMFVEEDVSRRGVCIHAHSFVAVFFFKLGLVVADADGHRALWSLKGAAGKLPCGMCLNVMNDPDLPAGMVGLNCSDPSQFRFATSADLWRKADMLHAYVGISTKAMFQDLQKATGLHYQEQGVLWDVALREHVPVGDVFCYDPMHVLVANGLAQTEVDHVLAALEASGVSINDVHKFMAVGWQFCRVLGSDGVRPSDRALGPPQGKKKGGSNPGGRETRIQLSTTVTGSAVAQAPRGPGRCSTGGMAFEETAPPTRVGLEEWHPSPNERHLATAAQPLIIVYDCTDHAARADAYCRAEASVFLRGVISGGEPSEESLRRGSQEAVRCKNCHGQRLGS